MPKQTKRPPKLPQLLDRKIYKTGQTRGADDDVIFQNRVSRNSTVLIPYATFTAWRDPNGNVRDYENGFIALVSPVFYFNTPNVDAVLAKDGLEIGKNAVVFYETREQWNLNNPDERGWVPAESRLAPLGGQYVARVAATTAAANGDRINRGFTRTANKGAGIRIYEYATSKAIQDCRWQLEALFWLCADSMQTAAANGMIGLDATTRKKLTLQKCEEVGLLDVNKLAEQRILNKAGVTICPLCLEEVSASGFFNRMAQAEGRDVHDLTVTQLNLFHIEELKLGVFNHQPYNLGWGHHHCNVVVKDAGITQTIEWMDSVVYRNIQEGHFAPKDRDI